MIKKDIRYIIKKVLIGILISLGVLFFKPLLANAEELPTIYAYYKPSQWTSDTIKSFQTTKPSLGTTLYENVKLYDNVNFTFNINEISNVPISSGIVLFDNFIKKYYFIYYQTKNLQQLGTNIDEINLTFNTGNSTYTYIPKFILKNGNDTYSNSGYMPLVIASTQITTNYTKYTYNNNDYYYQFASNNSTLNQAWGGINNSTYDNLSIVWKGSDFPNATIWKFNGEKITDNTKSSLPGNYEKINMFNKYAVLFYPKDFRNIPTECTKSSDTVTTDDDGNVTIIPNGKCDEISYKFNFYYAGYFNTAFANLKDMSVVSDPVEQLPFPATSSPYELPLYKNIEEFKGGILFYNDYKSQITDDNGNVTIYYDKGFIWYDSSLYNYIIIDDPNSKINQDISYIDENGETQTTTINNIPSKNKTSINPATDTSSIFENFKTNDHGLSSIITSPLEAIKSLTSSSCTSVDLPIPFSKGQTIKLPCMSSIYENKFGVIYTMYKTIITGYIGYWVCVRIYTLIKGFKDPDDDKVEVLDL